MIRFALTVLLIVFAIPQGFAMGEMPSTMGSEIIGKPAIEFTLETTAGKTQTFAEARGGKKAILVFWATWCPHCREDLEVVRQKLGALTQEGIQVVLINVGETKEDARGYLQSQNIPLESFLDEDNIVPGQYGVIGIPTLIFFDEKGVIRSKSHGWPENYLSRFNS
jgi:peroxiredoxin